VLAGSVAVAMLVSELLTRLHSATSRSCNERQNARSVCCWNSTRVRCTCRACSCSQTLCFGAVCGACRAAVHLKWSRIQA
jgi:hypothetical protein